MISGDCNINWKEYVVENCPPSVYYVPNFISEEEESSLLQAISKTPKPRWTQLSNRRLINYGGIPHAKGMIAEDMPTWLTQYVRRINELDVFEPGVEANHVLVNEYMPGQGIMPHLDGPLFYPTIATISCGSYTVLEYDQQTELGLSEKSALVRECVTKLLIEPRSLLVVKDDMYHKYFHSIKEQEQDTLDAKIANLSLIRTGKLGDVWMRGTRISLTIRHVPKTSKLKIKIF